MPATNQQNGSGDWPVHYQKPTVTPASTREICATSTTIAATSPHKLGPGHRDLFDLLMQLTPTAK